MKQVWFGVAVTVAVGAFSGEKTFADPTKDLYDKHCKKCHASDGSGKKEDGSWLPVAKTLKLEKPEKLNMLSDDARKMTDDEIVKLILEGKEKMKPLKEKITEADAKALTQYTRELQAKAK